MSSEQSSRKYFKSWSVACLFASFSVICAGFSPATVWPTKTSRYRNNIPPNSSRRTPLFITALKRQIRLVKGGSRGNIFALSFKVTECHSPLRHHGVFYVILRGRSKSVRFPDAMIFAFYSVVIERTASEFGCRGLKKRDKKPTRAMSRSELSSTRNENSDGSVWWRRLAADRKSGVAVFSA